MSGYESALAYFRDRPDEVNVIQGDARAAQEHAATIVRGLMADDVVALARAEWDEIKVIAERWPSVRSELRRLRTLTPPVYLPAVLASVEDVAVVARAAGFVQANETPCYWKDEHDVLLDVTGEYGDDDGLDEVCVQRADDSDVATVNGGAPGWLLWRAIEAARSAS